MEPCPDARVHLGAGTGIPESANIIFVDALFIFEIFIPDSKSLGFQESAFFLPTIVL